MRLKSGPLRKDGVLMRRQFRRHVGLGFLQGRVGVGAGEIGENAIDAFEQFARFFHGHDRVFESRRLGVGSDRLDLLELLSHALLVGRRKMLVLDAVKRGIMKIETNFLSAMGSRSWVQRLEQAKETHPRRRERWQEAGWREG